MIYLSLTLYIIFISHCHRSVYSISTLGSTNLKTQKLDTDNSNNTELLMTLNNVNEVNDTQMYRPLRRVKKSNDGAGKFTQAARMEQIKLFRVILQLFKNSWDSAYIGGAHPLHPNVPKAVIGLYKLRIVDYFFPQVGEDPKKQT